MTRRRGFGIDLPEDPGADGSGADAPRGAPRRGPMASAVREAAESSRVRAETEAAVRAENDALAEALVRLRALGLTAEPVPLALIDAGKLVRDRHVAPDPDVEDLKASLRAIGLSNPIRLERAGDRYELIQGWRRLHAYRALLAETGDPAWAAIPAGIVAPGDDLETSYRRMVDENLVRRDLSFAEMAELARAFAADPAIDCADAEEAVARLYRSAPHQKRSYIRAFAQLLEALDGRLAHPRAIPRNLGLEVRRRLGDAAAKADLLAALAAQPDRSEAQELSLLRAFAAGPAPEAGAAWDWDWREDRERTAGEIAADAGAAGQGAPRGDGGAGAAGAPRGGAGAAGAPQGGAVGAGAPRGGATVVDVALPAGPARCRATAGRAVLMGPGDIAGAGPERLARAVAAFWAALED